MWEWSPGGGALWSRRELRTAWVEQTQREPTAPSHGQPWKLQLNFSSDQGQNAELWTASPRKHKTRRTGFSLVFFLLLLPLLSCTPVCTAAVLCFNLELYIRSCFFFFFFFFINHSFCLSVAKSKARCSFVFLSARNRCFCVQIKQKFESHTVVSSQGADNRGHVVVVVLLLRLIHFFF